MSWIRINEIIGFAAIDQIFCRALLANPLAAVERYGFTLTPQEKRVFQSIVADTLEEFSKQIVKELAPKAHHKDDSTWREQS